MYRVGISGMSKSSAGCRCCESEYVPVADERGRGREKGEGKETTRRQNKKKEERKKRKERGKKRAGMMKWGVRVEG